MGGRIGSAGCGRVGRLLGMGSGLVDRLLGGLRGRRLWTVGGRIGRPLLSKNSLSSRNPPGIGPRSAGMATSSCRTVRRLGGPCSWARSSSLQPVLRIKISY